MTNTVEIVVRTQDEATKGLKGIESSFKTAGATSGKGFSDNFSKSMGGGTLGSLFGKGSGSVTSDAQKTGQNAGMGLARGILQKFNTTLGSGLLSGLFGTSGGNKLFGSAGNTVVQDAQKQGQSIAQGLGKGLTDGFGSTQSNLSGMMSGLFGGGGTSIDAENQGKSTAKSFSKGLDNGFGGLSGDVSRILGGLFGGPGAGADEDAGKQSGTDFGNGFTGSLTRILGGISLAKLVGSGGGKSDGGGGSGTPLDLLDSGGVAGGALPGVAGVSGKAATLTGLGGALLGALPAVTALGAGLGVLGAGFAILDKSSKGFANQVNADFTSMGAVVEQAVKPLAGPFLSAFSQLGKFVKSIGPELGQMFSAAAPLIQPLLSGVEKLVSGLLPGLVAILKAASPAFSALSSVLGSLGKDIGGMLSGMAPVIKASSVIFAALADVLSALFPIIGRLAGALATALAPVFATLAGVIKTLLPTIVPLINILVSFAGAVLTDLVGMLGSVGTLLKDLAPSFTLLAKAAGQVFNTLENSGVFATLANVLEGIAPVLAQFINLLVKQLAPILPTIIKAVAEFYTVLDSLLLAGLAAILQGVTKVLQVFPQLVPILAAVGAGWLVLNGIMAINPFVAVAEAIIILVGVVVKYHTQIWNFIVKTWDDIKNFLTGLWNGLPKPLQAALSAMADDMKATWDLIAGAAKAAWALISGALKVEWDLIAGTAKAIWDAMAAVFKVVLALMTGNWTAAWNAIKAFGTQIWNDMKSTASSVWNDMKSTAESVWNAIKGSLEATWNALRSFAASTWNAIESTARAVWNAIWANTVSAAANGVRSVESWVGKLPGAIEGFFRGAGNWLYSFGSSVLTGFLNGVKSVYNSVVNFFHGLPKDILNALGIHSPPDWAIQAGQDIMNGLGIGMNKAKSVASTAAKEVAAAAAAAAQVQGPGQGIFGLIGGLLGGGGGGGGSAEDALRSAAAQMGWTGAQWQALYNVEMREAGFNLTAQNPSSGAYGMAQFINGPSEYAQYGGNVNTASGQAVAMVNYIAQRYGTPEAAWAHEENFGWYAAGGPTSAGWAVVGEQGREAIKVPGGATVYPHGATNAMLAGGGQSTPVIVQLEVASSGGDLEAGVLKWIRNQVRVKGGGNVQLALGKDRTLMGMPEATPDGQRDAMALVAAMARQDYVAVTAILDAADLRGLSCSVSMLLAGVLSAIGVEDVSAHVQAWQHEWAKHGKI